MLPALLLSLAAAGPLPAPAAPQDAAAEPAQEQRETGIAARVRAAVGEKAADKPFLLIVSLTAKEGQADALVKAYRGAAAKSLAEPGCTSYALSRDAENPLSFVLYERWKSVDALKSHLEQPYTKAFVSSFGELLSDSSVAVMRPVPPQPRKKGAAGRTGAAGAKPAVRPIGEAPAAE